MPAIEIQLRVVFSSPPSIGAGGSGGTLADKVVTRDALGRFIVPASQLKGRLRHACEQIARSQGAAICRPPRPESMCPHAAGVPSPCVVCSIFGSPALPCALRFHDLIMEQQSAPEETLRPMVSLNRARRVAAGKRLFLFETAPFVPELSFARQDAVSGHVGQPAHADLLLAGLKLLATFGGGSSRGLGWARCEAAATVDGRSHEMQAAEALSLCRS